VIEKREPSKSTYIPVGTTSPDTTQFRVIRLVAGNEYVLQVSAENEVGVGEPAELSQGITAKSPFSKLIKLFLFMLLLCGNVLFFIIIFLR
jgi:hypothetical protein